MLNRLWKIPNHLFGICDLEFGNLVHWILSKYLLYVFKDIVKVTTREKMTIIEKEIELVGSKGREKVSGLFEAALPIHALNFNLS